MTESGRLVLFERKDGVAFISLNREEKANSYNEELLNEFSRALTFCEENMRVIRVLVIGSAGTRFFCAGADKDELRGRGAEDSFTLRSRELFDRVAAWPGLTVAAVGGAARGGGTELALACDIRLATEKASFGFPEISLGLIPAAGGCRRLTALIGPGLAKDMIMLGRIIGGREAVQCGLANYLLTEAELRQKAEEMASRAAAADFTALRLAKAACASAAAESPAGKSFETCAQALLYELKNRP
ncbi:enoyl-CoA hydratase/isomerase family protein [bacterium]|nr:enoyl-CoA hydratase/isomerase family protein [bacterium]